LSQLYSLTLIKLSSATLPHNVSGTSSLRSGAPSLLPYAASHRPCTISSFFATICGPSDKPDSCTLALTFPTDVRFAILKVLPIGTGAVRRHLIDRCGAGMLMVGTGLKSPRLQMPSPLRTLGSSASILQHSAMEALRYVHQEYFRESFKGS
jgi:hypothetical protein